MEQNEKFLLVNEHTIAQCSVHSIVFATPLVIYLASLVLFLSHGPDSILFGFFLLVIATLWVGFALSRYLNVRLILTNQRLLLRTGVLKTYYVGYFLHEIAEIVSEQNLLGRWLEFGRIIVRLSSDKIYTLKPYGHVSSFVEQVTQQHDVWLRSLSGEGEGQAQGSDESPKTEAESAEVETTGEASQSLLETKAQTEQQQQ